MITADANVLLRAAVGDDPHQQRVAIHELASANKIAIGLVALCEFAWVLLRRYRYRRPDVAIAIRLLINDAKVEANRPAISAGLDVLDAGGDFADGVIAHEGERLGADEFISFDQDACTLLSVQGKTTRWLK